MAKKILKFLLVVFVLLIIVVAYGVFIGGELGLIHCIVLLIVSGLLLILLYKNDLKKDIGLVIFLSIMLSFVSYVTYYGFNLLFDNSNITNTSTVQVSDLPDGRSFFEDSFYYLDENSNEICYSEYRITPFDLEIGDTVIITEYKGAFDVKYYKLTKLQ